MEAEIAQPSILRIHTIMPRPIYVFLLLIAFAVPAVHAQESQYVFPGQTGRLLNQARPSGDRIPDFSGVGYKAGNEAIPNVPAALTISPTGGGIDDTRALQAAIDQVSAMPLGADGFRGAVQLTAGEFLLAGRVQIRASGVVLRGAGDQAVGGTTIRGTGTGQRSLVEVVSSGSRLQIPNSERTVLDKYVPVGATSLRVADASSFSVGDPVVVFRPSTAEWISALGTDNIPPRPDGQPITQWAPGNFNQHSERTVTRVEGDRVFFDVPITNSLDEQFGGGTVYKYSFANRLENVGIEDVRGVSDFEAGNPFDENHASTFISVNDVDNAWVRGTTAQHFVRNAVSIEGDAKHVTVVDSHSIDPVSIITGGRRYSFEVDGQLNIVRDSTADSGRHDFMLNSPSPGPNVFFNNVATNALSDTGPHQRYSTGGLFDNDIVQGDQINVRNRGYFGTGHGWAGANMVIWNSQADSFIVQNTPTAQNWVIGSIGTRINDTRFGQQEDGLFDNHGQNVATQSLYLQQLADRQALPGLETREYVTGDYDNFVFDGSGSVDNVPVNGSLQSAFASILGDPGLAVSGFDQATNNNATPFSWNFGIAGDERVVHAVLSVSIKGTGGSTVDDEVYYESLNNVLSFSNDLELTSTLSTSDATVLLLEFTGADDLGYFQDGEFNLLFTDDTVVDWARLDLTVADNLRGDLNFNGVLDADDIETLCSGIHEGTIEQDNPLFDLNGDNMVDASDLEVLLTDEIGTLAGDANLDFFVDASDFNLWNQNRFSSGAGHGGGDFNCDGVTDASDFNIWNENKFRSADNIQSVPEPECIMPVLLAIGLFTFRRKFA